MKEILFLNVLENRKNKEGQNIFLRCNNKNLQELNADKLRNKASERINEIVNNDNNLKHVKHYKYPETKFTHECTHFLKADSFPALSEIKESFPLATVESYHCYKRDIQVHLVLSGHMHLDLAAIIACIEQFSEVIVNYKENNIEHDFRIA